MKVKTSITLSPDVLEAVDQLASTSSRSAVIELALREYIVKRERAIRGARDIAIYNKHIDEYNALAEDLLRYQAPIEYEDE